MLNIDKKITDFIKEHHVLTIASSAHDEPWCAHCFYAYLEKDNQFVFTSDVSTKHATDFEKNNKIAATVTLETDIIGKIQGIQLTGTVLRPDGDALKKANNRYLKRFPFAILMNTTIWVIQPDYIKMTDNRLGFGKKLIWNSNSNETIIK